MEKQEVKINLTLTLEQVNVIIEGLVGLPYGKVYKLIESVHVQANQQLNPSDEPESNVEE